MTASFRFERFSKQLDRKLFRCGEEALDRYFQTQVTQDIRRHVANCFVAIDVVTNVVAGFYTLASASIPMTELPFDQAQRLPRYPTLPAVRIGRLAVDQKMQGRGLGAAMLADAAQRVLNAEPASFALLVDAKNDRAIAFYQHHGFRQFSSKPEEMYLPLATALKGLLAS